MHNYKCQKWHPDKNRLKCIHRNDVHENMVIQLIWLIGVHWFDAYESPRQLVCFNGMLMIWPNEDRYLIWYIGDHYIFPNTKSIIILLGTLRRHGSYMNGVCRLKSLMALRISTIRGTKNIRWHKIRIPRRHKKIRRWRLPSIVLISRHVQYHF